MLNAILKWHRQREIERELAQLTDRELADIGIERADIAQVARLDPAADKRQAAARSGLPRSEHGFKQAASRA